MESRHLVSVSRRVSRPVFSSLGLECLRSRLGLELETSLETLHELFFFKSCKKRLLKNGFYKAIV